MKRISELEDETELLKNVKHGEVNEQMKVDDFIAEKLAEVNELTAKVATLEEAGEAERQQTLQAREELAKIEERVKLQMKVDQKAFDELVAENQQLEAAVLETKAALENSLANQATYTLRIKDLTK